MSASPAHDGRRTVSLVLGAGGARGLAHIGVIRALERGGWTIGSIAGSSIGALIGGFYAAGRLEDYAEWVLDLSEFNVLRFLDVAWGGGGMIRGQMLMDTLERFVGSRRIEDLPVPLTVVATDVLRRKEVWLRRGDLFDAIRASIAVPMVFTPHVIEGRPLLDGAILNPVPIAATLQDHTDAIIAVSLSGVPRHFGAGSRLAARKPAPEPPRHPYRRRIDAFLAELEKRFKGDEAKRPPAASPGLTLFDTALLSLDAMQASIARAKLAAYPPDLLIEIPINTCAAHEFYRAQEVIEAGERLAERALTQFVEGQG